MQSSPTPTACKLRRFGHTFNLFLGRLSLDHSSGGSGFNFQSLGLIRPPKMHSPSAAASDGPTFLLITGERSVMTLHIDF